MTFSLRSILGRRGFQEIFTSENDRHAAAVVLVNLSPQHVFNDIAEVARPGRRTPCWKHQGRLCPVPNCKQDLFASSFVCKGFSR